MVTVRARGEIDANARGWLVPVTLVDDPPEDSRLGREEPSA